MKLGESRVSNEEVQKMILGTSSIMGDLSSVMAQLSSLLSGVRRINQGDYTLGTPQRDSMPSGGKAEAPLKTPAQKKPVPTVQMPSASSPGVTGGGGKGAPDLGGLMNAMGPMLAGLKGGKGGGGGRGGAPDLSGLMSAMGPMMANLKGGGGRGGGGKGMPDLGGLMQQMGPMMAQMMGKGAQSLSLRLI